MISPALLGLLLTVTQTAVIWTRPPNVVGHDDVPAVSTEDWSRGLELLHASEEAIAGAEEELLEHPEGGEWHYFVPLPVVNWCREEVFDP